MKEGTPPPDNNPIAFKSDDPESEEETLTQVADVLSSHTTDPDDMWTPLEAMH